MTDTSKILSSRREFLFLYDIRMGNPNGDPDENRPRKLPDGTHYVTDVRLKRFVRDHLKSQGKDILVDTVDGTPSTLTNRVVDFCRRQQISLDDLKKMKACDLAEKVRGAFVDARLFGSPLAFQDEGAGKLPVCSPITGAVQINHGEVKHKAHEEDIHGTSILASKEKNRRGTFTAYFALRYALIAFNGVANEHSAELSGMTNEDYADLLKAMWNGVRSSGNTRSKCGQVPRLLISVTYRPKQEFQFGNLADYITLTGTTDMPAEHWASPDDYTVNLTRLQQQLRLRAEKIEAVEYCMSPDLVTCPHLGPADALTLAGTGHARCRICQLAQTGADHMPKLTPFSLTDALCAKDLDFDGPKG